MKRKLLVSGDRANFTTLELDTSKRELCVLANFDAPHNASWIEPSSSNGNINALIGLSEGDESGLLYTFMIDHLQRKCTITSCLPTLGAPGHFAILRDESAIVLITYLGGSIALYPMSNTIPHPTLLESGCRTEIFPEFPYRSVEHGPNQGRQRQCHPHQAIEDGRGFLYFPDLGSDRVWIFGRTGMKIEDRGWLQCPAGSGPRHAVISPDGAIMYVIGELSHTVIAFDLLQDLTEAIQPIEGFAVNVVPPTVHPDHQFMMDSSEICLHPSISNVLYVSNRWERHIAQREPHLRNVPKELSPGDAIAIVMLTSDGRLVEKVAHVRTNLDVIRGMRLSNDGKYVVLVGQEGGGVEIYEISGDRGDRWELLAAVNDGLEPGLKHAVWL